MRIRTIKPEFFTHEGLFEAEKAEKLPLRVAFAGLWCVADREGRFKWEPRRIGVQVLPYDNLDFSRVLHALMTRGFVVKYGDFGVIPSFPKHQVINNREKPSELPEPPPLLDPDASGTREPRDDDATSTCLSGKEGKGREGEGKDASKARAKTLDEISAFCSELQLPTSDAEFLWNKWNGCGWRNGGTAIKDWRATVRSWKVAGYMPSQKNNGISKPIRDRQ